jgi:hypothetical protein
MVIGSLGLPPAIGWRWTVAGKLWPGTLDIALIVATVKNPAQRTEAVADDCTGNS